MVNVSVPPAEPSEPGLLDQKMQFVDWELPWLVKGEDGRFRLPPGAQGELPLFFSLRASKPD